jgi:hypothetical protein
MFVCLSRSIHVHVIGIALYPLYAADYPKHVLPDLHLIKLFQDIELLKENCERRHLMVDINQLTSDYQRWFEQKKECRRLRELYQVQEKLREQSVDNSNHHRTMCYNDDNERNRTKKKKKDMSTTSVIQATDSSSIRTLERQ